MTVQFIPVRTTGPAQTEGTASTAAAHQALMEHNVKQVTTGDKCNRASILRIDRQSSNDAHLIKAFPLSV